MASLVVSTIYFGLMGLLAGFFLLLALVFPKRFKKIKIAFAVMSVGVLLWFLVVIPVWARVSLKIAEEKKRPIREAAEKRYNEARAVFDEQCKKAGEKIYRTVDNVDGVMLLKVRGDEEYEKDKDSWGLAADPMWSHAAIAELEFGDYVQNFFGFERTYLFVDVLEKDGSVSRYLDGQRRDKDVPIKNPSDPARYAVTYENNVDPELRQALGSGDYH